MTRNEFWLILLLMGGRITHHLKRLSSSFLRQGSYHFERDAICLGGQLTQLKQLRFEKKSLIVAALRWLEADNRSLVVYGTPEYPVLLQHISSPPLCLFVEGKSSLLQAASLAMVGSRQCSRYGERCAKYFAEFIAQHGLVINSGLALGIDSICHRAALQTGRTLAVLGSGLANVYPKQHRPLAKRILEEGGALVSEFLPETAPLPGHFPRRNRIISGLSLGVCLIEASLGSGSLITVQHALSQGREVFVLPGPFDMASLGGNFELLKQGACLVTQPIEILAALGDDPLRKWLEVVKPPLKTVESVRIALSSSLVVYQPLLELLDYDSVTDIDRILQLSTFSREIALEGLLELELAGHIEAVYGGYIRKNRDR